MIEKINHLINSSNFNKSKIYLLDYIDENNGFLLNGNSVWFISKNINQEKSKRINTMYLILNTNLFITGVSETTHFQPDYYNVIMLKDFTNNELLDIFISLCHIYVRKIHDISFEEYFDILIDLFQIETKETIANILGLYGELSFIKYVYDILNIDLSPYWHLKNSYDTHDFYLPTLSLEVKTTIKNELIFNLKHSQVFDSKMIVIVLVRLREHGNGNSLSDLMDFFINHEPFNSNLKFIMSLNAIISKLKKLELLENKYVLNDIKFYINKDLITITDIPNNITSVSYLYDFNGQKEINIDQFNDVICTALQSKINSI